MAKNNVKFHILFRSPVYPVLILSADQLMSAYDPEELADLCVNHAKPVEEGKSVKIIDATAEEFQYSSENHYIMPGLKRRWPKKQIIGLYNEKVPEDQQYPMKSLSAKKVSKITADIFSLVYTRMNPKR